MYKNPIPSVDDEYVSRKYTITFSFGDPVSLDEAVEGINDLLSHNGGKVSRKWVKIGEPKNIRYTLPQD